MVMPTQPGNLFSRPFAHSGTYKVIPDTKPASGRASLSEGFPTENQLPLSMGGVAPNRMDFNGILHMLSAFSFWQQSGGQWTWKNTLNYAQPSFVFHNNAMWWCVAPSGPETGAGAKQPGTDTRYWVDLFTHLANTTDTKTGDFTPVGTVIMYHGIQTPEGYLACDGSSFSASRYPLLYAQLGKATTPDLRGQFIRGYDPAGSSDPEGARRTPGSRQVDMGRAATGNISHGAIEEGGKATGVFEIGPLGPGSDGRYVDHGFSFDISRAWGSQHTGSEFRPVNTCLLYCIKHD